MQHSKSMAATSSSPQHFLKLSPHRYVSHCCHGNNSSCIEVMQQAGLPLKFGAQHSMHRVKHTLEVQNAQRRRAATWTPTQSSVSKMFNAHSWSCPNSNNERYSNWYSKSRWKKKTHKSTTTCEELHTDPKTDRQNFRYTLDVSSKTVRKTCHRDRCEMEDYKVGWKKKKVLKDAPKSLAYTVRPFFPQKNKQAIK